MLADETVSPSTFHPRALPGAIDVAPLQSCSSVFGLRSSDFGLLLPKHQLSPYFFAVAINYFIFNINLNNLIFKLYFSICLLT